MSNSLKNRKTMKKTILLSIALMTAFAAQAQLKVAPKIQLHDQKTYSTTSVINIPGQKALTMTDETTYTVREILADGYVIGIETTKVTSDATADNIAGQLMAASQEMMAGNEVRVAANNDGKLLRILNYTDVKQKMDSMVGTLIDKLLKSVPQLAQMPIEMLKQQIMENTTEENLLKTFEGGSCPLALNGKTITTGAQDEYVSNQGLKMKRMYFVNGQKVTTNSTLNMSKDDIKQLIIAQIEKIAPEQAEMVKQNIEQVMASGMVKIDMKETSSYDVQADSWVKSITAETTNESMGQTITIKTNVALKP